MICAQPSGGRHGERHPTVGGDDRDGCVPGCALKSRDASVAYVVCVKFPTGTKLCASAQGAQQGKVYVNKITSTVKGTHKVA